MQARKQADLGLKLTTKRTHKREFLALMERGVSWLALAGLVAPYAPERNTGRPPFSMETMPRIHFMRQCFTFGDPAIKPALRDVPLFHEFACLGWAMGLPDNGLLLKAGTVVDATLIAAPSSTKSQIDEHEPKMHQAKKGNQWCFGMKAHIGVGAE